MRHALVSLLGLLLALTAQAQSPSSGPPAAASVPVPLPTITFGGSLRIDQLYVREIDGVQLRLIGTDTLRRVTRENLPPRLQAGQTYRDVRVRFEYRVSVAALDSVLRPLLQPTADTTRRNRP